MDNEGKGKLIAFGWYGGKYSHLNWLLPYFLHLFHRIRIKFLDAYQDLVLAESDNAVRQELKIAFLALRRTYESAYSSDETTGTAYNIELPLAEENGF